MLLQGQCIEWVNSIEYLGTHIVSSNKIAWDIQLPKRHFYAASTAIIANAKTLDELLHLTLHEIDSLPISTYAVAALSLSAHQLNELNVCWKSIYQ
jgi:hypothetical protein